MDPFGVTRTQPGSTSELRTSPQSISLATRRFGSPTRGESQNAGHPVYGGCRTGGGRWSLGGLARHPAVVLAAVMSLTATLVTISWPAAAQESETHSFSGTITSSSAAALANVRVSVFCEYCSDGPTSDPSQDPARPWPHDDWEGPMLLGEATTAASGEWSVAVEEPARGRPLVVAWDPAGDRAFSTVETRGQWADMTGLDASLADGGRLSGQILADGGAPPTTEFILTNASSGLLLNGLRLVVASNGEYLTPGLSNGDYALRYPYELEEPYVAGGTFSLGTISSGNDTVANHDVAEYASLSGRVTDGSGRGLGGIYVFASAVGSATESFLASAVGGALPPAITSEDGTYSFSSAVPATVFVIAFDSADGEYADEYYDDQISYGEADRVEIPRVGDVTGIDAQLAPGGTISGNVRDLEGQPVQYVGIRLCPEQDMYSCFYDSTDESGDFEFVGLAAASYRLTANPRHPLPAVEKSVVLTEGGHQQVDFQVGFRGAFSDDEGTFYEAPFDALSERGIFAGTECNASQICPEDPITRATLAVWLGRALTGEEPPPIQSTRFADVARWHWQAAHIERFADLEVTRGCASEPLRYCPDDPVKRGSMAAFLVRAFDLPDAASAGFTDTDGHFFANDIDALAAAGVTKGCTAEAPPRYCPNREVTRGQMATFIARALGLA